MERLAELRDRADSVVQKMDAAPGPTTAHQLGELTTGKLDGRQRRAALEELLAMAEAIERGLDQLSGQLQAQLAAEYTGRSQGGHVTVKVSGAGAIGEVRYDRAGWRKRMS